MLNSAVLLPIGLPGRGGEGGRQGGTGPVGVFMFLRDLSERTNTAQQEGRVTVTQLRCAPRAKPARTAQIRNSWGGVEGVAAHLDEEFVEGRKP